MSRTRIIESVKKLDLESTRTLLDAKPGLLTVTDRQERSWCWRKFEAAKCLALNAADSTTPIAAKS